jgi:hypothetical protein
MKMQVFFGFPPSRGGRIVPVQADTADAAVAQARRQGITMTPRRMDVDGKSWDGYSDGSQFYLLRPVNSVEEMAAAIKELEGMTDLLNHGGPLQ